LETRAEKPEEIPLISCQDVNKSVFLVEESGEREIEKLFHAYLLAGKKSVIEEGPLKS
jgi:hypothetical protein